MHILRRSSSTPNNEFTRRVDMARPVVKNSLAMSRSGPQLKRLLAPLAADPTILNLAPPIPAALLDTPENAVKRSGSSEDCGIASGSPPLSRGRRPSIPSIDPASLLATIGEAGMRRQGSKRRSTLSVDDAVVATIGSGVFVRLESPGSLAMSDGRSEDVGDEMVEQRDSAAEQPIVRRRGSFDSKNKAISIDTAIELSRAKTSSKSGLGQVNSARRLSHLDTDPLNKHWSTIRKQTRTSELEDLIARRNLRGHWRLKPGEYLDSEPNRNQHYDCLVRFNSIGKQQVSADDCIAALNYWKPTASGLKILDLGCGVGSFLTRHMDIGTKIDWETSCGVTAVHPTDIAMFQPPSSCPSFFTTHLLRFDLDYLSDNAERELAGVKFDLITGHYCFCHLKDALGALIVAFDMLDVGGYLYVVEPLHEPTNGLPFTHYQHYHFQELDLKDEKERTKMYPVELRELLIYWARVGVAIFSSYQAKPRPANVLVLRRPSLSVHLSLPPKLHPGEVPNADNEKYREKMQRWREADKMPYFHPNVPDANCFNDWLNRACQMVFSESDFGLRNLEQF